MITLYIGNKNYSSWSLRGWLAVKLSGAPFEEQIIQLHRPETPGWLAPFSPSGRVPVIVDHDRGGVTVWDSLAICEYLAETFPQAGMWPAARDARAVARSVSAEMHSSFQALRELMPMNIRAEKARATTPAVDQDIARIRAIWGDCRARFGKGGPFLFGAFSAADCMFAPVVARFRTYGVKVEGAEVAYAQAIWDHPFVKEWAQAGRQESWTIPAYDQ